MTFFRSHAVYTAASTPFDVLPLDPIIATSTSPELACVFDRQGALVSTDSDDPSGAILQRINPIDLCSVAESELLTAAVLAGRPPAGLNDVHANFFTVAEVGGASCRERDGEDV